MINKWMFDKKQLRQTPSQTDGVDYLTEIRYRKEGTTTLNFISFRLLGRYYHFKFHFFRLLGRFQQYHFILFLLSCKEGSSTFTLFFILSCKEGTSIITLFYLF